MKDGNNVEMAEPTSIGTYPDEVRDIIKALASPMHWTEESMDYVFVSDLSTIGDFCLEDEDLVGLSESLGVEVKHSDNLVELARRIHLKKAN